MTDTKMERIADKIQKLLALAGNNPSEAEAKAALLKAQALMAEYNVDMEALQTGEKITYDLIVTKVKAHKFNNTLGTILADAFACRIIIMGGINKIAFFGRSDNAKAVASAMEFTYTVMHKGQRRVAKKNGVYHKEGQANFQNSYTLGFLYGLKTALDAQTVALAVVVPKDVNDAFAEKFPNIRKTKRSNTKEAYGRREYEAGLRDGSSVMARRSIQA